ncbi:MAG: Nif11-like leader peptide family natural product precursor, partial [Desulfobacterales bacterium]|nr:Nif11-like leader peptide family natural product precursor [Desulfobacterales bacterium]
EERMAFVTAAGFDFTKEELENVQEKMQLTDEELERLSGGLCGNDLATEVHDRWCRLGIMK